MNYKVILTRTIEQSTVIDVEAKDFAAAKVEARRQHESGLEWDDDEVEYGVHEIHGGVEIVEFNFED
jgi:hypothetical protein